MLGVRGARSAKMRAASSTPEVMVVKTSKKEVIVAMPTRNPSLREGGRKSVPKLCRKVLSHHADVIGADGCEMRGLLAQLAEQAIQKQIEKPSPAR